ncbi:MAG: Clp protease N-terminal domain-containing protein, partial [Candidatus Pacebacteria bacterium]|nr:Clp protease N-terminal domain-containing protein [Candidatus Paceibacterota bacterium]
MLSKKLEITLHRALDIANQRRHEYATLEHLLLSLIEDQDALEVFKACSVNLDHLRRDINKFFDEESSLVSPLGDEAKPAAGFQRVVQRAVIHVQSSGRAEVTGANVLVALFSERESHAVFFLQEQDMTRFDAVNFISHGIAKTIASTSKNTSTRNNPIPAFRQEEETVEKPSKKPTDALENFCVNLNKKANSGRIDPLIGREAEVERTIQILCRRNKNNPLYVGEPGVGKTA